MSRDASPMLQCGLMEVLGLTIFISLLLAVFFVVVFNFSQRESKRGLEQEALLPFDDNVPVPTTKADKQA